MTYEPEIVERMVALVREMASAAKCDGRGGYYSEAEAIAMLLPDPDLITARRVACDVCSGVSSPDFAANVLVGTHDNNLIVRAALAGIKHKGAKE